MRKLRETQADIEIRTCLDAGQSFSMVAGAGSGKTTSLITALRHIREMAGPVFRRDGKKVVCITYTNRAVEVISSRLDWDDLFLVSTLHSFLWGEVKNFKPNIREALREHVIPARIEKKKKDDNGGRSKKAVAAREKVASLEGDLENLDNVPSFDYDGDSNFSNYSEGKLSHDDVIDLAAYLISENEILRRIIGQKYPYIFVDEAQDTFGNVVSALNKLCENEGLPIIGYFGDPMQQIYDKRAGDFAGPLGSKPITKEENYRCSLSVIDFLNRFRTDVQQVAAGDNVEIEGSVLITLVQAEAPEAPRKRYTEEQIDRALSRFDKALANWGWDGNTDVKRLYLARQMIARRQGFYELHKLFTGQFASSTAQENYEAGKHVLLSPLINSIYFLVSAQKNDDQRKIINILRRESPAFDPQGINAQRTLKEMKKRSEELIRDLAVLWGTQDLGDILRFCRDNGVCRVSDRLSEHLDRAPREEDYDREIHASDKGDWLADTFLAMTSQEIGPYVEFVTENTPFSTQHGVKGEQYHDVLAVFDDVEAAWNNYSFSKTLTPATSGDPTEGQYERSRKLAYVCFSRAERNLRIVLFTQNPEAAKQELVSKNMFEDAQVFILD